MTITYRRQQLSRPMAHKLAMCRATRGWTLAKAAAEIGCSISSIHAYENAQRVPSVPVAGDIARAYRLNQEDTIALMAEAVTNAGRAKRRAKAAA